jgi:hypothetical protein
MSHFLGFTLCEKQTGNMYLPMFVTRGTAYCRYNYGHGISSVKLLSIRKNLCSLSFIVIMTDIQNFCDRNFVTHTKNQNATSNVFDIYVKNSNVGLEIYKTSFTANVS